MKWINQYTGYLRTLRVLYWVNNFLERKWLIKNKAIYKKLGIHRSVLRSIDSRILNKYVGDIRQFSEQKAGRKPPSHLPHPLLKERIKNWDRDGYLILKGLFSQNEVDEINADIESGLQNNHLHYNYTQRKIFNAHQKINSIKTVSEHPIIVQLLENILGNRPIHFQTINFNKGSEQQAHSDSIHMTTLPLGRLVGVWVALEEVHSDNGPLIYYPGSHQLPYVLNDDYGNTSNRFRLDGNANAKYEQYVSKVIQSSNLKALELNAKPGDVLIWHANLLHGGAAIKRSDLTRKSIVLHYFADDVLCFHEISERPAIIH